MLLVGIYFNSMSKNQDFKIKTEENDDEKYFRWYLEELQKYGFIKYYEREPETFLVLPSFAHTREKHLKTKENPIESFNMLNDITYTYDFRIIWERSALNIFTEIYDKDEPFKFGMPTFVSHNIMLMDSPEIISYVDVKPHASASRFSGSLASFYTFPFVQKILMHEYKIFINKAVPVNQGRNGVNSNLFATTFTPTRYLYQDKAKGLRKIPFKRTSITTYVNRQKAITDSLLKDIEKKNLKNQQQTLL